MKQNLAFRVTLPDAYDAAVDKVVSALKTQGFGVLTRIDVKATLKEKLDAEFRPYVILGACNPPLAHRALESEPLVGLLLPCNVTVESVEGGVLVSMVNPESMLALDVLSENATVLEVAAEARSRLEKVVELLRAEDG